MNWLNELSGKNISIDDFHITSDCPFIAFFSDTPAAIFTDAIFWYGDIYIQDSKVTPTLLAHEFGHSTDAHLNYFDYATSNRSLARMEAVAEAFEHYITLELSKQGSNNKNKNHFRLLPLIQDKKTLDEIIDDDDAKVSAESLIIILINDFRNMKDVWYFLATTDEEAVYERVESIISECGGLIPAIEHGYPMKNIE